LVLDAGGYVALGIGDPTAAAWYRRAIESDWDVILPVEVVAEVMRQPMTRGVRDWQQRILAMVHKIASPTLDDAMLAASLMAGSASDDVVDAFVAVAAFRGLPAFVLTSDPSDIRALLDVQADGKRVALARVDN
jgi:predicted nucleic acid-binding protein